MTNSNSNQLENITISYTKDGIIDWLTAGDYYYKDCLNAGSEAEDLANQLINEFIDNSKAVFLDEGYEADWIEDWSYSFGSKIEIKNEWANRAFDNHAGHIGVNELDFKKLMEMIKNAE